MNIVSFIYLWFIFLVIPSFQRIAKLVGCTLFPELANYLVILCLVFS